MSEQPTIEPAVVSTFHDPSDQDFSVDSGHHSLGGDATQAAPGNHLHLNGITLIGSKGGNVALASVINALVQLGAKDATT